ncbi:MAG: ligand-binding sensor domain-containing protein, partial [Pyrinomonadaceae bacterium]
MPARPANLHQWGAVTLFHGLPSDRVRAIAQDADGAMWFGTDAGLVRYDGRRTQTVSEAGLAAGRVHALHFDAGGALWVGTDAGAVVRTAGGEFKRVEETEGKSVTAVADAPFEAPERGRVLMTSNAGAVFDCRVRADGSLDVRAIEDRLLRGTAAAGGDDRSALELTGVVAIDRDIFLVATRGRGLLAVEGGAVREVAGRTRTFFVEALERDAQGGVWYGAQTTADDSGVYEVSGRRDGSTKVLAGATGTVTALRFDRGGDMFVATDGRGVFRHRGRRRLEHFTFAGTAGGLRSDRVYSIFIDREGVAWFGTDRGVCRYDPHGLRNESLSADAESNFVRALFQTADGRLLAGTNRG